MDNRYSHRRTCSPRYRRLLPCLVSSFSAVTLLQPLPPRYPGVNLFPSASLFLLLLLFFSFNPLGLLSPLLLSLFLSLPPSVPPPSPPPSPPSSTLCYTFFSPYLPLRSASFAPLARSEESPAKKKVLPCPDQREQGEACAASSLPHWLSIALFISHSLSQKHRHSFFLLLPPTCLASFSSSSAAAIFVSLKLGKKKEKEKGKAHTRLKCNDGTNKEEEEAKLCSQWHKREAERALETKSGNSAKALQTERGDGWKSVCVCVCVCWGGGVHRHTHSFTITHTYKQSAPDIDL